jgi:hypothetical protein
MMDLRLPLAVTHSLGPWVMTYFGPEPSLVNMVCWEILIDHERSNIGKQGIRG